MAGSKRPLKWILAVVAVIAALVGLTIGRTFIRAQRLLEEQLRETKAVLETFPPETTGRPAIFDPPEPGNAWDLEMEALHLLDPDPILTEDPPAWHRFPFLTRLPFEPNEPEELARRLAAAEPHLDLLRRALRRVDVTPAKRPGTFTHMSLQTSMRLLLTAASEARAKGKDLAAAERLVMALGCAQDVARHGDLEHRKDLWDVEAQGALLARDILEAHSFSAEDLASFARWLDRLAQARPPIARTILVDSALERRFAVDLSFSGAIHISDGLTSTVPTWRELWSTTLHSAKRAAALTQAARALDGFDAVPTWQREDLARRRLEELRSEVSQSWELPSEKSYQCDAVTQMYMTLLRVGVALAWHEVERGNFPETLSALLPRYLPAVPVCPYTGHALLYERGRIRSDAVLLKNPGERSPLPVPAEELDWTIRRAER